MAHLYFMLRGQMVMLRGRIPGAEEDSGAVGGSRLVTKARERWCTTGLLSGDNDIPARRLTAVAMASSVRYIVDVLEYQKTCDKILIELQDGEMKPTSDQLSNDRLCCV